MTYKYLLAIGIIIVLVIIYCLYDNISSVRKLCTPAYQKIMSLEARISDLEKRSINVPKKLAKIDSPVPVLSITYQSDMAKNKINTRYADLSDSESKRILKDIGEKKTNVKKQNSENQLKPVIPQIQNGGFSETNIFCEDKPNISEYQKLYEDLKNIPKIYPKDDFKDQLDQSIVKNISETLKCAAIETENTLSSVIPEPDPTPKKKIKKIKEKKLKDSKSEDTKKKTNKKLSKNK